MERLLNSLIVICFILIILALVGFFITMKECNDKGGKMVGTGEYTTTTQIINNQVIVSTTENMVCDKE
ncbi:hypothetical protein P5815_21875 [Bacillus cereus]|uniref:hypothetical protein n=1 Tax=Bacillus cereus group TaxID=86661 RepID=UPI002404BA0B|nr:hypothetical protein [Bacillus cereus]MDF9523180.1 hypothetical protein [Bacillus cereus]MDF9561876.1 hypothetical protein [Bacillus cereus]HEQ3528005.1 hypothetical protein [Bacillus cereus]